MDLAGEPTAIGAKNPRLRRLRQLSNRSKARSAERAFVVDGPVLAVDAMRSDLTVTEIFASPDQWDELEDGLSTDDTDWDGVDRYTVEDSVLIAALDPVNPRPVAAVVAMPERTVADLGVGLPILVAVELRDPGNLGTMMRTAEAAGLAGGVVVGDSVDVYSPKTVRASAGSVLRTPVVKIGSVAEAYDALRATGRSVHTAIVDTDAEVYDRLDLRSAAIVVGNEPHGLSAEAIKLGDGALTIPLSPSVESLNAAAAASVLCFEAARQQRNS